MTTTEIEKYFSELNDGLKKIGIIGEMYLFGGAVMCLALKSRVSTKDIDAVFEPKDKIYEIAKEISESNGLQKDWINDAVKGFLSDKGEFSEYSEMSNLRVFTAVPEYVLSMKCMSMRIGESEDVEDVKFLLKHLSIKSQNELMELISKYYREENLPQKTFYAIQEIFEQLLQDNNGNDFQNSDIGLSR